MLLLTVQEWLGHGKKMTAEQAARTEAKMQLLGFCTRLSLSEAITHLHKYENAYNVRYLLGLTLKVVAVSEIDDIADDIISKAGMELIEKKPTEAKDFE